MTFQIVIAEMKKADKKTKSVIQSDNNKYVTNMWLNRTDWAKYLIRLNYEWLRHLICKSEKWKKELKKICMTIKMMIWKIQKSSHTKMIKLSVMNYINKQEMSNNTNEKLFNTK